MSSADDDKDKQVVDFRRRNFSLTGEEYSTAYAAQSKALPSLDIRFNDGRGFGIPYSYIRGTAYDFSKDKQTITLHTAVGTFKIVGFHLKTLKGHILAHTAQWIEDEGKDKAEGELGTVSSIVYEEGGREK